MLQEVNKKLINMKMNRFRIIKLFTFRKQTKERK